MTAKDFFTVDAHWALQGKTPGRDGYRVLACSTGLLSADNFTEAIGRFSMGTPETLPQALPQVTISYLPEGVDHLALAINRFASDAQTADDQLLAHDDDGRPVVVTSYYCVPYDPLAKHGVPYRAMHEAFAAAPLRSENGPALRIELPSSSPSPAAAPDEGAAFDLLTVKTAALLVSGRPVCVLGAVNTSMAERLAFIDAVMTLLPYGFRARMSAATWTRATNQNHRFRLFFSGARRDAKEPDHVVTWGRAELTPITPDDDIAYWYLGWLRDGSLEQKLRLLADRRHPRSLGNKQEVHDALDEIAPPPLSLRRVSFSRGPAGKQSYRQEIPAGGAEPTREIAAPVRSAGEQLLLECAEHMEKPDTQQLSDAIKLLDKSTKADVTPDQRDRYRELIKEHRFFRHNVVLGECEAMLREVLLRIAFTPPLSYEDYCLIEDGVGEAAVPDSALLQLVEKKGLTDNRVKAIVYRQMPGAEAEKKLNRWFPSKDLSADRLLNLLAIEVKRPQHTRLLCDVTLDYLRKMSGSYAPKDIDRVLRQHSYLARKLQDSLTDQNQYQIEVLGDFLRAAYPDGLTRSDIYHVMIGTKEPPTLPFLAAVHLMVTNAADAYAARELFVYASFMAMGLMPNTTRELEKLILSDSQASSGESESAPQRGETSTTEPPDGAPSEDSSRQSEGGRHRLRKSRMSADEP